MPGAVTQADLLALVSGALEPGRRREVEREVQFDSDMRRRVTDLRTRLADAAPPPAWRIPPPGVRSGRGAFGVRAETAAVMGAAPRPGDRSTLWLADLADAAERLVVVLHRTPSTWAVVFPTRSAEGVRLSELPRGPAGERRLDVVLRDDAGSQRWAVALPLASMIDWAVPEEARWTEIRAQLRSGLVPVAAAEVQVG